MYIKKRIVFMQVQKTGLRNNTKNWMGFYLSAPSLFDL